MYFELKNYDYSNDKFETFYLRKILVKSKFNLLNSRPIFNVIPPKNSECDDIYNIYYFLRMPDSQFFFK